MYLSLLVGTRHTPPSWLSRLSFIVIFLTLVLSLCVNAQIPQTLTYTVTLTSSTSSSTSAPTVTPPSNLASTTVLTTDTIVTITRTLKTSLNTTTSTIYTGYYIFDEARGIASLYPTFYLQPLSTTNIPTNSEYNLMYWYYPGYEMSFPAISTTSASLSSLFTSLAVNSTYPDSLLQVSASANPLYFIRFASDRPNIMYVANNFKCEKRGESLNAQDIITTCNTIVDNSNSTYTNSNNYYDSWPENTVMNISLSCDLPYNYSAYTNSYLPRSTSITYTLRPYSSSTSASFPTSSQQITMLRLLLHSSHSGYLASVTMNDGGAKNRQRLYLARIAVAFLWAFVALTMLFICLLTGVFLSWIIPLKCVPLTYSPFIFIAVTLGLTFLVTGLSGITGFFFLAVLFLFFSAVIAVSYIVIRIVKHKDDEKKQSDDDEEEEELTEEEVEQQQQQQTNNEGVGEKAVATGDEVQNMNEENNVQVQVLADENGTNTHLHTSSIRKRDKNGHKPSNQQTHSDSQGRKKSTNRNGSAVDIQASAFSLHVRFREDEAYTTAPYRLGYQQRLCLSIFSLSLLASFVICIAIFGLWVTRDYLVFDRSLMLTSKKAYVPAWPDDNPAAAGTATTTTAATTVHTMTDSAFVQEKMMAASISTERTSNSVSAFQPQYSTPQLGDLTIPLSYSANVSQSVGVYSKAQVEIIGQTISKSILAIYAYENYAEKLQIDNVFFKLSTEWCGWNYNLELKEDIDKYRDIYKSFIFKYQIDMNQFTPSDYRKFSTVNSFFIRALKPGVRPINPDASKIIAPCDGRATVFSINPTGLNFWIKGSSFNMGTFLGGDAGMSSLFNGGTLMLLRMTPSDYHRFHAIADATLIKSFYLEGSLHSLSADGMTSRNYAIYNQRTVMLFNSSTLGVHAFVAIGALCVGSVVTPNGIVGTQFRKGDELGYFQFGGSTIALVFQPNKIRWNDDIIYATQNKVESLTLVGQAVGTIVDVYNSNAPNTPITPSFHRDEKEMMTIRKDQPSTYSTVLASSSSSSSPSPSASSVFCPSSHSFPYVVSRPNDDEVSLTSEERYGHLSSLQQQENCN